MKSRERRHQAVTRCGNRRITGIIDSSVTSTQRQSALLIRQVVHGCSERDVTEQTMARVAML